ncbi:MAG: DUF4124 domain-containing protein [Inhella sp.]|jgi:hypothetical protein|uniref:DUF4124 domain-containing protein n=1 Tax=Inhella sp. TaxID=1921806 RepID=UPI0022C508A5|nr:DUF4124 domain-containing protein [Inhella sp.]MCZ8236492.1 DUF4124 domain-containing protein [Inhella sp.]
MRIHALTVFTSACLLGLSLSASAASATWQWRDAQGNIQFSDRAPPPSVPDKDILKRPPGAKLPMRIVSNDAPPPASAPTAPATRASSPEERKFHEAETKRLKQEEAQRKAVEASNAKIRAENCRVSQAQVRDLEAGTRLVRSNEKGEREFLDDQQRAAELNRARAVVASDCR